MRPQLTPLPGDLSEMAALAEEQLEDLGWNDMGTDVEIDATQSRQSPSRQATSSEANAVSVERSATQDDEDAYDEEEAHFGSGPHPIIDPVSSAEIVPFGGHASSRTPANEDSFEVASPVVRNQQRRLARRILSESEADGREIARLADPKSALLRTKTSKPRKGKEKEGAKSARRAAFTLRLDTDRHLKLRLAATMNGVSAQSLVTEALDALLDGIEDLDTLAERMKRE